MSRLRSLSSGALAILPASAMLAVGCSSAARPDNPLGGNPDGVDGAAGGDGIAPGGGDGGGPTFDVGETSVPDDAGTSGDCAPNLTGRLRDFVNKPGFTPASALDDDFENANGDDRGMVETELGADMKPVYAHPGGSTPTTHGQEKFDAWYRDTPKWNQAFDYTIVLTGPAGGVQTFNDQEFFPLDGRGWNDEYTADDGKQHNFSFTFELHTTFGYHGGETFTFTGDDDVLVFVDRKLVVDLGGVHGAETKSIALDTLKTDDAAATAVTLAKGTTYPLDIFYNERHTVSSHFRMDTSIAFNNCKPIIVK